MHFYYWTVISHHKHKHLVLKYAFSVHIRVRLLSSFWSGTIMCWCRNNEEKVVIVHEATKLCGSSFSTSSFRLLSPLSSFVSSSSASSTPAVALFQPYLSAVRFLSDHKQCFSAAGVDEAVKRTGSKAQAKTKSFTLSSPRGGGRPPSTSTGPHPLLTLTPAAVSLFFSVPTILW